MKSIAAIMGKMQPHAARETRRGAQEKIRLDIRRSPKYEKARGLYTALSHELAKINEHWFYADAIIRRMTMLKPEAERVYEIEDATPRQMAAVLSAVKAVK